MTDTNKFSLRVFHFDNAKLRTYFDRIKQTPGIVLGKRGGITKSTKYLTIATIKNRETGETVATGFAVCGKADTPQRKHGYRIATGRAWKQFNQVSEQSNP